MKVYKIFNENQRSQKKEGEKRKSKRNKQKIVMKMVDVNLII